MAAQLKESGLKLEETWIIASIPKTDEEVIELMDYIRATNPTTKKILKKALSIVSIILLRNKTYRKLLTNIAKSGISKGILLCCCDTKYSLLYESIKKTLYTRATI